MSVARPIRRFSLETKVMAAVLAVLVILPALTLWNVDRGMRTQMQVDAAQMLTNTRNSILQRLRLHTNELTARFRPGLLEPRFQQVVRLNDAATMKDYLRDVLEVYHDDTQLALFF